MQWKMDSTCKPITKINQVSYPHHLLFFDTESYILINGELKYVQKDTIIENEYEHHILRLGVAIYIELDNHYKQIKREIYYFTTAQEFWNYTDKKAQAGKVLFIYAHNAKYDTLNVDVISELNRLSYTIPYPVIDNAFILTAIKGKGQNKKKIRIVDTFNYVRQPLIAIGRSIGVEKIELTQTKEIDFNAITDKELFTYCENDVHIIEIFMLRLIDFLHSNDLGSLKFTTSSTALDIYRHRFINHPIYYHRNDDLLKLERKAYRGGIVECFKLKRFRKQRYYLLDINSMYVSVMSSMKLPTYPIQFINENCNLADLKHSIIENYVIADVLININYNKGKFGLKYQDKESPQPKLLFPTGTFRVTLHKQELLEALKTNSIIQIFSYGVYHEEYCLNDYSNYFSELKKSYTGLEDKKVDYEFCKLLGNGLYGKFGQRKYKSITADLKGMQLSLTVDELNSDEIIEFTASDTFNRTEQIIALNKKIKQRLSEHKLKSHHDMPDGRYYLWNGLYTRNWQEDLEHVSKTNIALAGAVTAYARLLLASYIEIAGEGNAYYSDTDSIVVNEHGYLNLKEAEMIDNKALGKLKLETIFNNGVILAPKNYTFVHKKKLTPYQIFKSKTQLKLNYKKYYNNLLLRKFKSINISKRVRSKGIPKNSIIIKDETTGIETIHYMQFTSFKDFMLSDGNLKGRLHKTKVNNLHFNKGEKGDESNDYFTKPFEMEYIESQVLHEQSPLNDTETKQEKTLWHNQIKNQQPTKELLKNPQQSLKQNPKKLKNPKKQKKTMIATNPLNL